MAHIKIVHTDLRNLLMNIGPQQRELESLDQDREPQSLSFSELQILLERAQPQAIHKFQPKGKANPSRVARSVSLQDQHHFERLNIAKSVQASSADDGVRLSARSMVG